MKTVNNNSISGATLLGLIFVTLKLLDKIDWSWFWVLSPFWIPFAILFSVLGVLFIAALLFGHKR